MSISPIPPKDLSQNVPTANQPRIGKLGRVKYTLINAVNTVRSGITKVFYGAMGRIGFNPYKQQKHEIIEFYKNFHAKANIPDTEITKIRDLEKKILEHEVLAFGYSIPLAYTNPVNSLLAKALIENFDNNFSDAIVVYQRLNPKATNEDFIKEVFSNIPVKNIKEHQALIISLISAKFPGDMRTSWNNEIITLIPPKIEGQTALQEACTYIQLLQTPPPESLKIVLTKLMSTYRKPQLEEETKGILKQFITDVGGLDKIIDPHNDRIDIKNRLGI